MNLDPVVDVDEDDQRVQAWIPVAVHLAHYEVFVRMIAGLNEYLRMYCGKRTKVVVFEPAESIEPRRRFELRRGITQGIDISVWLDDTTLRVQTATMNRLDLAWALLALLAGVLSGLFFGGAFALGMFPHFTITRHWVMVAMLTGGLTTIVVAIVTWWPLRLLSHRGRKRSMVDARQIVQEIADAFGAELSPDKFEQSETTSSG